MDKLRLFVVDAFTCNSFSGNPAGVCIIPSGTELTDSQMLQIARELKHSETSFIYLEQGKPGHFKLRWFTPKTEVTLCGHGTLAAGHVLFNEEKLNTTEIVFSTLSGDLIVSMDNEKRLCMDFPKGDPKSITFSETIMHELLSSFCLPDNSMVGLAFCQKTRKLILAVSSISHLFGLKLKEKELMRIPFPVEVRGVAITTSEVSESSEWKDCDFVSRYFNPWFLDGEDPVNGSSHTILSIYYQDKLKKNSFKAGILSDRKGIIWVHLTDNERVVLRGYAVTVVEGSIVIPKI
eukprot:TRINITY_DN3395_c0_g1_i1.p1 TRINITY_DN3395_c0_g1~~TRINITY_DN3395_c0_g1_i1.p1  ORF type:complete len:292 (-),score=32.16 TRINITY_DN3395_c0_g1_i1:55-930(-)